MRCKSSIEDSKKSKTKTKKKIKEKSQDHDSTSLRSCLPLINQTIAAVVNDENISELNSINGCKKKKRKESKKKSEIEKKEKKKKKKKKEKKKKKRDKRKLDVLKEGTDDVSTTVTATESRDRKKRKRSDKSISSTVTSKSQPSQFIQQQSSSRSKLLPFGYKYVLAPMVGASELAFRLLCRKYGTQLAYTPMMSSSKFVSDPIYRNAEFQTVAEDRPLVCHFSANDPDEFASAAKLVQDKCDAIDLNLGCPQRVAYIGHYGSYLLDPKDRHLICRIVRTASQAVSIPIFCKIRLLDSVEDTIQLCHQLVEAGASLIAIHARFRASFERKGPGARDGPALLDQVLEIRKALGNDFPIVANGNVIFYEDVVENLKLTQSDGIMSAEGILDNPTLFLPRYGNLNDEIMIKIANPSPPEFVLEEGKRLVVEASEGEGSDKYKKKTRKLTKKLREIEAIEAKITQGQDLFQEQKNKLEKKETIMKQILELNANSSEEHESTTEVSLKSLYQAAENKVGIANEYLNLVRQYPTKLRTVIFHTRRMLKELLNNFQLMEECIGSKKISEVQDVVTKIVKYQKDPASFHFDTEKAKKEKEALERKRNEEGKRKAYEARMIRKAKRERRADLEFYLRQGSKVPTASEIERLRKMCSKADQLTAWKAGNHSQHCISYHLDQGGCKRDRSCAFLHVDTINETTFEEKDEVAG